VHVGREVHPCRVPYPTAFVAACTTPHSTLSIPKAEKLDWQHPLSPYDAQAGVSLSLVFIIVRDPTVRQILPEQALRLVGPQCRDGSARQGRTPRREYGGACAVALI
jgi:hypothetical protein